MEAWWPGLALVKMREGGKSATVAISFHYSMGGIGLSRIGSGLAGGWKAIFLFPGCKVQAEKGGQQHTSAGPVIKG
jgi:hypothetical protein